MVFAHECFLALLDVPEFPGADRVLKLILCEQFRPTINDVFHAHKGAKIRNAGVRLMQHYLRPLP